MSSLFKAQNMLRVAMSAALAAMCVAASSSAIAQDKVVMKLGHTLAPDNHYQLTAQVFAKEVATRTHGHIEIQLFSQSQLGGEV